VDDGHGGASLEPARRAGLACCRESHGLKAIT
jgi:hypothetical protein